MIKEIKKNRIIRDYLINLNISTALIGGGNIVRYKDNRTGYIIFMVNKYNTITISNIGYMCNQLDIEYDYNTHFIILKIIKDIYCAKKL